ncbi:hypothetical protein [Cognaticolwellia mytili]|uniref:hypothetical protein n=1 Tax=Cognaticolwellia mytili TaxID=1888913 RepID=UPI000A1712D8|nr:hypothetical protein [Cognaticolwellia mytili]
MSRIYEEEIEGREFDWYAIDSEGNFGLFSTAGEGFVPKYVLDIFSKHDDISNSLESPNWGSSDVFLDYSKLGFYVFDWDLPNGPYKKQCEPLNQMDKRLKLRLLKLTESSKLNINFKESTVVFVENGI